ncbi:MAG: osmotically inducible protein OsmC [Desulfuromonadales bacterium GWD2_61_12]|nr:MAG: osmotically inducible protein OsmC [Desulfuromonadales bacterium GWC2_61_20]OGR36255.1 MAG: osmotically inducible protein OsmC [Desulfuromonadales bacterium GWD2_61_12]HAD03437.1 osmotically inducible protein OsmC [Desulfuromonas sp.]HBT82068.1 osmotically inducible protein OsmC [Desulfuromonas sp.]
MEITFPGGVAVAARYNNFTILTDQPASSGGTNGAPSPFDLFLASLGTCAGFYALRFCQQRALDTAGLRLTLTTERDEAAHRLTLVRIVLYLPSAFPEKYHAAILKATDQCAVKRALDNPPRFQVVIG